MVEKFMEGGKLLIVSLPANDESLARAALDAGADALKVHLNVSHRASGAQFGTFDQELAALEKIASLPRGGAELGIMPGTLEAHASVRELERLAEMGFSFYDIYAHHMPVSYLDVKVLAPMVALGHEPDDNWTHWRKLGARMLEASVVDPELYGSPLTISDLAVYKRLCLDSGMPVIVPTQKKIDPGEVGRLFEAGVSAIMIGAIVTGRDVQGIATGTGQFRVAIDAWNKGRAKQPAEHPGFGIA